MENNINNNVTSDMGTNNVSPSTDGNAGQPQGNPQGISPQGQPQTFDFAGIKVEAGNTESIQKALDSYKNLQSAYTKQSQQLKSYEQNVSNTNQTPQPQVESNAQPQANMWEDYAKNIVVKEKINSDFSRLETTYGKDKVDSARELVTATLNQMTPEQKMSANLDTVFQLAYAKMNLLQPQQTPQDMVNNPQVAQQVAQNPMVQQQVIANTLNSKAEQVTLPPNMPNAGGSIVAPPPAQKMGNAKQAGSHIKKLIAEGYFK